jgi:hypothetical protein
MKRLFVISALVLSGFFVNAQGFSFGPKVGANITGISGLQFEKGFDYGYHIGAFAEVMVSEKFGIQPEILWSQTRLKPADSFRDLYPEELSDITKVKLKYISVPLLLNYRPLNFLTIQVGPQFGILRDKKSSTLANVESAFKSGDFSMLAGVQLKILSFRIYGRYGIGLSNLNDLPNQDSWKSKTLQLGVGIGF